MALISVKHSAYALVFLPLDRIKEMDHQEALGLEGVELHQEGEERHLEVVVDQEV